MMNSKKTGIVDVFIFFAPYGRELLDLRVNMLKDHVDWFIITELSTTHTGESVEYQFERIANELNLPMHKIIYLKCDIPSIDDIENSLLDIDILNTYIDYTNDVNTHKKTSQYARVRERMQRNHFLSIIDEFDDDTVFIISDSDEIIRPNTIEFLTNLCKTNPEVILSIPLMLLKGRADLRVYNKQSNSPARWDGSMFIAQRQHLLKSTPNQIRSNINNKFPIVYATQDGKIIDDLGWHFSWMGKTKDKLKKAKSFIHADEEFPFFPFPSYNSKEFEEFILETRFCDGSPPPCANKNQFLKKIPLTDLPDLMFTKREYIEFFFALD